MTVVDDLPTPQAQDPSDSHASWWSRAAAFVIDDLIVSGPIIVIGLVSGGLRFGHRTASGHSVGTHSATWYVILGFAVACAYQLLTLRRHGSHNGQTIGKQLLGIQIVCDDLRPVGIGTVVVREWLCKSLIWWSRIASIPALPFFLLTLLDYAWPLWDRENRALHDFVATTHVHRHQTRSS